jgi:tripartite-type tricarboxylate transporter receptor subunit TctC
MRLPRRHFLYLASAAVVLHAAPEFASAQCYPDRPVRMIVPYAPGGPTDVITRLLAQRLTERHGKQFFVENVGGGGGNIGMGRAAKAAPDGYTLLVVNPSYVINPTLYDKVPYEFEKDFDPVTLAVATTLVLTVHPSVPARTVDELVALIKAHPGKYSYASPGTGTPGHLVGEQFRLSLGLDLVHVPFNSAGLAVGASVAGHTPICFASPSPAAQQVIEGRLRGLAVTSKSRSQALPEVPTMAEAGYPNIAGDNWQAVVVPAGTPRDVVAFLHREIIKIIALPDIQERLAALGLRTGGQRARGVRAASAGRIRDLGARHPGFQYQSAVTPDEGSRAGETSCFAAVERIVSDKSEIMLLTRRGECREAALQISDEIVDVLKPDVDAHRGAAGRPFRRRPDGRAIEGNRQAFIPAP